MYPIWVIDETRLGRKSLIQASIQIGVGVRFFSASGDRGSVLFSERVSLGTPCILLFVQACLSVQCPCFICPMIGIGSNPGRHSTSYRGDRSHTLEQKLIPFILNERPRFQGNTYRLRRVIGGAISSVMRVEGTRFTEICLSRSFQEGSHPLRERSFISAEIASISSQSRNNNKQNSPQLYRGSVKAVKRINSVAGKGIIGISSVTRATGK